MVEIFKDIIFLIFGEEIGNVVLYGVVVLFILFIFLYVVVYSFNNGGILELISVLVYVISIFMMFILLIIYYLM